MAHRERFMKRVSAGQHVVSCRVCPKRHGPPLSESPEWASYKGGKAVFSTARECHDWWREHVGHPFHALNLTPEARHRRQVDRDFRRGGDMSEWFAHVRECETCRDTRGR